MGWGKGVGWRACFEEHVANLHVTNVLIVADIVSKLSTSSVERSQSSSVDNCDHRAILIIPSLPSLLQLNPGNILLDNYAARVNRVCI